MKGNPRSLISLCVNYKRLGKYLIDEWSRFILNTHCKNHMCKNAQKSNQNCLNPFRTTNNLKSKSLRRQQKPQSFDFTLAISNDSICSPSQISLNAIFVDDDKPDTLAQTSQVGILAVFNISTTIWTEVNHCVSSALTSWEGRRGYFLRVLLQEPHLERTGSFQQM